MNADIKHIERVLQYLNEHVNYALLRNFEGLPHHNKSRDIDIIIEYGEFKRHKKTILEELLKDDWRLFSYLNNGRLITFVCAKMLDAEVHLVQWDFFIDTSVHGVELLGAKEMVQSRQFNGQLYHVSTEYEFLDKYLYNRAVGAPYPEKYRATRDAVEGSDVVKSQLKALFGCSDMASADALSGRCLFLRALRHRLFSSPLKTIGQIVRSWWIYFRDYRKAEVAPTLAFTGADGAGKTTVIEMIEHQLSAVYGKATQYFHFRPLLIPNLGEAAHSAGLKKEVDRQYDRPHRGERSGVLSSFCRLVYYTLDYLVGHWLLVKPHAKITKVIIFDRYYNDVIVDSRRSSIYLNTRFLYWWGRLFVPRLRYNFLVTAHADVIFARKQELDREGIEQINSKMEYLADKKGYYLIMNNGTAEECVEKILRIVIEEQHQINMKKVRS